MQITRVRVQNYKSLYGVEIDGLRPLTILVGPNDSGKSAILQTISIFKRAIGGGWLGAELPFAEVMSHNSDADSIKVNIGLSLDAADRNDFLNAVVDETHSTRKADVRTKLPLFLDEWFMHVVECEVAWYGEGQLPLLERMSIPLSETEQANLAAVSDDRQSYYTVEIRGVAESLDNLYDNLKKRPGIPGTSRQFSAIEKEGLPPTSVPAWVSQRLSRRLAFAHGTRAVTDESEVSFDEDLSEDGSNVLPVLWQLRDHRKEVYDNVLAIVERLVPGSGHIGFRGRGRLASLVFETSAGAPERLSNKGAGLEQLIVLATRAAMTPGCIALLEEPESHLHPRAQREFVRWLRQLAEEGRQFIVSTHSPVFINEAGDSAAVVWVSKQGGKTGALPWNQRPEGDKAEATCLLTELGIQPSDALLYNALLLAEGRSDCDVFRFLAQRTVSEHRPLQLGITHYEGGRGKAVARYLGDKLTDALSPFAQLRVKIVRDRGALTQEEIDSLRRLPNMHVLQRYELENYLLNPTGVAAYVRERCERDSPSLAEVGVQDATRANVEKLLPEAAAECAPWVRVKQSRDRIKGRFYDLMKQLDQAERDARKPSASREPTAWVKRWTEALSAIPFSWEKVIEEERSKCAEEDEAGDPDDAQADPDKIPGSAMLDCVFRRFGLRYEKDRDAGPLAASMPPEHWQQGDGGAELRDIVESLLNPNQEESEANA